MTAPATSEQSPGRRHVRRFLGVVRDILMALLALPAVLLARLARPLVLVRFGVLPTARIGTLAANVEVYLCERDAGLHGRRTLDLFCDDGYICNTQLRKMWGRVLAIIPFVRHLDRMNRRLPGDRAHVVPLRPDADRDVHGLLAHGAPHVAFTAEEVRLGDRLLEELGVAPGRPFVCFHARDHLYLETRYPVRRDWRYHDYRNSDIRNYLPAAEALVRRGYLALRLGAAVGGTLPTTDAGIIDYAATARTDFLDVYLSSRCRFFLGDSSGLLCLPEVFRRPLAIANLIPLEYAHSWGPADLFIPKKLWLRSERRLMTFREIIESGVGRHFHSTEDYEKAGIEVIENTADEIKALGMEMDDRLHDRWVVTEEERALQQQFWSLFKGSDLHGVIRSSIGAVFLREHAELLD